MPRSFVRPTPALSILATVIVLFGSLTACKSSSAPPSSGGDSAAGGSPVASVAVSGAPHVTSTQNFSLRMGDDQASGIPGALAEQRFAKEVTTLTHGHVKFTIFPNNALGDEASQLTQIQTGSLDSGVLNMASISSQLPALGLFGLPYLLQNTAAIKKLANSSTASSIFSSLSSSHVVGLGITDDGPYALIGNKKVTKAADLKGQKVRTQTDPASVYLFGQLGANVVALPFPQVYSALQQHVVDGAVAGPASMERVSLYQVSKYLAPIDPQSSLDLIMLSQSTWSRLPNDYKQAIQRAAKDSQAWNLSVIDASTKEAISKLQSQGVTVTTVDTSSFAAIAKATANKFASKIGKDYVSQAEKLLGTS